MAEISANMSDSVVQPVGLSRSHKRIIVCCDGTWQDGLDARQNWKYTNVLRLARAINHVDERAQPPIHQVVFYQSGIGTENLYDKIVDGVTGATLASKVEDAYGFIAHNYRPGDEIFLFGFSRGAYTARMVAMFIGAIGVLDRTEMDHFASIFLDYQKRGKAEDPEEVRQLDEKLQPWTSTEAVGRKRADFGPGGFSVKIVGVFDTVGSVGLPEEISFHSDKLKSIFGFPDKLLGEHVARAYQALAINETRADFDCAKYEQTDGGRQKGQVLKQCWFTGSHCDIGGGFQEHDLSDVTLNWIVANIGDALSLDYDYLGSLPRPNAPWGSLSPHNPLKGIYSVAKVHQRSLPTVTDDITHEVIHPSVLEQTNPTPELSRILNEHPEMVHTLLPWEVKMKEEWTKRLATSTAFRMQAEVKVAGVDHAHQSHNFIHKLTEAIEHMKSRASEDGTPVVVGSETHSTYVDGWLGKVVTESSVGVVVQELLKK